MKNKKPTIMISGYYGFGNAGDDAILAAIVQQIKDEIPSARIIVLSESPDKTSHEYDVESHNRKNFGEIFKLMGNIDLFLSGGGGLVQDATGFSTVVYYLSLCAMAKLRGKKVMLYAQGLGPLHENRSRFVARHIMNLSNLITYRDENSRILSEEIGIKKPPVYVTADPVFALKPPGDEVLNPIALENKITREKFNLGISVRPWNTNKEYQEIVAGIADSFAREKDADIFLFPFQESQDMEICKAVAEKMKKPAQIVPRKYSISSLMGLIGRMDMVVGMRLHSLIFSVVQNVPVVGISYDPKVTTLMEMIDLPYVNVDNIKRKELFDITQKVYQFRDAIKKDLPDKTFLLKEKAQENIKHLKSLL